MTETELITQVEQVQQTAIERYHAGHGAQGAERAAKRAASWRLINRLQRLLAELRRDFPEACTFSCGDRRCEDEAAERSEPSR